MSYLQYYNAKIKIQSDRIAYLVSQKNTEYIKDRLTALIFQAHLDLEKITEVITDPNKIEFFKSYQELI